MIYSPKVFFQGECFIVQLNDLCLVETVIALVSN